MSMYVSKYAVCPYYHRHDDNRICCEGTEDSNTINLVFGAKSELKAYSTRHCNDLKAHKQCMIYQMLEQKYSEHKGG